MYLTVVDAAKKIRASQWNIYYAIYFGHVDAVNLGGDCWRIREASLYAYDQRRRGRAVAGAAGSNGDQYAGPLFGGRLPDYLEIHPKRKPACPEVVGRVDHPAFRRHRVDERQLELAM